MKKIILVLLVLILGNPSPFVAAQAPSSQSPANVFGEVNIQSTESDQNVYLDQQTEALAYVKQVSQKTPPTSPSDRAVFFLAGLYLYCSGKAGACPFVLDTILAGESLTQDNKIKATCPTMKRFWEAWVKNNFEERLPYLVSIGTTGTMKEFNDNKRGRYLKCGQALADFKFDEKIARNVTLTEKLIIQLKEKQLNIFEATGAVTKDK